MAMKARMKGGARNTITSLNVLSKVWPPPQARDGDSRGADPARWGSEKRHGGYNLDDRVAAWPTPTARDHRSGLCSTETASRNARPLSEFVGTIWATPTVKGNHNRAGVSPKAGDGLATQAARLSETSSDAPRPDPATPTDGRASSSPAPTSPRRLNHSFVEWLMGWPEGWTLLALASSTPSESMPSGCSATAFTLWRRRMRSELSALASQTREAEAQLSLWG